MDTTDPLNIILTPMGSAGDVHPFVGLGAALKARGHDVTVITNGYFRNLVERTGLAFIELGTAEEFEAITADPDLWHWRRGPRLVLGTSAEATREQYARIESRYDPSRTVLIHHMMSFGARTFEDRHAVPSATVHLAPISIRTIHDMPALRPGRTYAHAPQWLKSFIWWVGDRAFIDSVMEPEINSFRRELNLPPVQRPLNQWCNSPHGVIGMFPDWFAKAQPDWPAPFVQTGFPLWDDPDHPVTDPALNTFLNNSAECDSDRPIAFTFGSPNRQAETQYRTAIEIAERLNRRAILLTSHAAQIPATLPDGVMHISYAPFSQVFPHCALVVHHGGIGTTAQSFAAGVPQLIVPMAFDQPDHATRVRRLGVGDWIVPRRFTATRSAATIERMLNDSNIVAAAAGFTKHIHRESGLQQAGDVIENLLRPAARNADSK